MPSAGSRNPNRSRSPLRADGLVTWLALSPKQVNDLVAEGAEPDPFSRRFGLRQDAEAALQRATDFMGWRPKGESEVLDPKTFSLCKVTIPSAGYMHMMESGKLECRKEGEWRLYGRLRCFCTKLVRSCMKSSRWRRAGRLPKRSGLFLKRTTASWSLSRGVGLSLGA